MRELSGALETLPDLQDCTEFRTKNETSTKYDFIRYFGNLAGDREGGRFPFKNRQAMHRQSNSQQIKVEKHKI